MRRLLQVALAVVISWSFVAAAAPGGITVDCDVNRKQFRLHAGRETEVTFRLFDSEVGGTEIGGGHTVPMADLLALKVKPEKFDGVKRRVYVSLQASLGSDLDPVDLGTGEVWLDLDLGGNLLGCDEGKKTKDDPLFETRRRKLESVAFAVESESGGGGPTDMSVRAYNSTDVACPSGVTVVLPFDSEQWDTASMHDGAVNNSRLTAAVDGKYLIFAHVKWESVAGDERNVSLRLNGTTQIAHINSSLVGPVGGEGQNLVTHYALNSGDYVEVLVRQMTTNPPTTRSVKSEPGSPVLGMVKLP